MSTSESVATIDKGSRVVYAVGDKQYNGIALAPASVGYNQQLKHFSAYLNLVYLNEAGETVKVSATPLLGTEIDADFLVDSAVAAAKKDARWHDGNVDNGDLIAEYQAKETANPRTIGWKPDYASWKYNQKNENAIAARSRAAMGDGSTATPLPPDVQADLDEAKAKSQTEIAAAEAGRFGTLTPATEAAPQTLAPESAESSDLTPAAVAEEPATAAATSEDAPVYETKRYADESSATGIAPLPDLSPDEHAQVEAKSAAPAESELNPNA